MPKQAIRLSLLVFDAQFSLRESIIKEDWGHSSTFIGVDIEDSQDGAREFIAEFGLEFDNYFDRPGVVRATLGGVGVPITYFFASDGELVYRHNGVIDERTLSLQIDEILNR